MPLYVYKCENCKKIVEVIMSINDDTIPVCEECGQKMTKQITGTTFVLKGEGWTPKYGE